MISRKHLPPLVPLVAALWMALAPSLPANEGFPKFSWERVPKYAHIGIGNGMTKEQIKFLAENYELITFSGGVKVKDSVEQRIGETSRAIKKINPDAKVLFYFSPDIPKHQWKNSNASFPKDGYVRPAVKGSSKGEKSFDVTKPEVQEWWTDVVKKACTEHSCDGVFADGLTAGTPRGPWNKLFGKKKAAELDAGMKNMMKLARKKLGPDKMLIFNPLHGDDGKHGSLGADYLPFTDGAMVDDFDRGSNIRRQSNEYLASTIETMSKASKDGKLVIFKAWPGFTWWSDRELVKKPHADQYAVAKKNITFPLACFLTGAGPNCYFCYSWGWLPEYGTFDTYPEYDKPLGAPKGEAKRDGWKFTREFEHASVFVDIEKRSAKIDWKKK